MMRFKADHSYLPKTRLTGRATDLREKLKGYLTILITRCKRHFILVSWWLERVVQNMNSLHVQKAVHSSIDFGLL